MLQTPQRISVVRINVAVLKLSINSSDAVQKFRGLKIILKKDNTTKVASNLPLQQHNFSALV